MVLFIGGLDLELVGVRHAYTSLWLGMIVDMSTGGWDDSGRREKSGLE